MEEALQVPEVDEDLSTLLSRAETLLMKRLRHYGLTGVVNSPNPGKVLQLDASGLLFDGKPIKNLMQEEQVLAAHRLPGLLATLEAQHNRAVVALLEAKTTVQKVLEHLRVET